MITEEHITGGIVGVLLGVLTALGAAYKYIQARISSEEAKDIFLKAKDAIDEYNKAKQDGTITTEEKLMLAEKTLSSLETLIKALES